MHIGPETGATCFVFTYKEGLLSPVAHDLKLAVTAFSIEVADDYSKIEGTFDPRSLRVVCTMRDGREGDKVSARDRRTIEGNIVKDVLEVRRFGEIRVVSTTVQQTPARTSVEATLTLHGKTEEITLEAKRTGGEWIVRTRLHQPDFGIKPFSAMMGTLKVKPEVDILLRLPVMS